MLLPILISVSVAPVSYFFWARALPEVAANAMSAVEATAIRSVASMISPQFFWSVLGFRIFLVLLELADQLLCNDGDLPGAVRYEEDDEEQQHAEHRAGEALGNALRDVGDEDDEGGADDRSGQPANAADDHAEEQLDRERDGEAVGGHELHGNGAEATGYAGNAGRDAECQR